MPKRSNKKSLVLTPPTSSIQQMFVGKVAANASTALTITTQAGLSSYRVTRVVCEVSPEDLTKPCKVQLALRSENGGQSTFSFPVTVGSSSRTIVLKQTRGESFWTPAGTTSTLAWIQCLNDNPATYTVVVHYTARSEFKLITP